VGAHSYNSSYSKGRDRAAQGKRPALAKSSQDLISTNNNNNNNNNKEQNQVPTGESELWAAIEAVLLSRVTHGAQASHRREQEPAREPQCHTQTFLPFPSLVLSGNPSFVLSAASRLCAEQASCYF
jgi:hypothetical protein